MKAELVLTVLNERNNIRKLIGALEKQTQRLSNLILIDGGSIDGTTDKLKRNKLRIMIAEGVSRSKARNLGVKLAKANIIVMTDAGCIPDKNWLKRITEPFKDKEVDIVAGFYTMDAKTPFQKAASVYLGVLPADFDDNFLPSTRSIAFRKRIWKKVGGFPEELKDTAEDTVFNYRAVKAGAKIVRVKNAIVRWGIPKDFWGVLKKMYRYAKGDAQSKILWNPGQRFSSHNLKVLFILTRYLNGILLLVLSFNFPILLPILIISVFIYLMYSFAKVFKKTKNIRAGVWGIPLQIASDIVVMGGFLSGIVELVTINGKTSPGLIK